MLPLAGFLHRTVVLLARGQCIEHPSESEVYLPVLEARGQLGGCSYGSQLADVLHHAAPLRALQLLALFDPAEQQTIRQETHGTGPHRMLRELGDAPTELSMQTPLVLVWEDLDWSDTATVDVLSYLARRREAARLLVIAPIGLWTSSCRSILIERWKRPQRGFPHVYLLGAAVGCAAIPIRRDNAAIMRYA